MQFPQQFPFLVIPTGAGPGQDRILINVNQSGAIEVIGADDSEIDIGTGGGQATITFLPAPGASTWSTGRLATTIGGGNHPALQLASPTTHGGNSSVITIEGGSAAQPTNTIILYAATTHSFTGNVSVFGTFAADNIQFDTVPVTLSASPQQDVTVTFGHAFANTPTVVATLRGLPAGSSALIVRENAVSTTQVTFRVSDVGGVNRSLTINVDWIAISL